MSRGNLTVAPGLMFGGTAKSATFTFTAKLACSGTSGVKGGDLTATGTADSNDCIALAGQGIPTITATIDWKGKFSPSTVVFSDGNFSIASAVSIKLPSTGPSPPVGTSTVTGSFADEPVAAIFNADQSVASFEAGCNNKTQGLTGFTFTGVNGPSTLTIPAPPPSGSTNPTPPAPQTVAVDASSPGAPVNENLVGFNHPVAGSQNLLQSIGTTWARTDTSFEVNQGTSNAAYNCTTGAWNPTYLDSTIAIDRAAGAEPELIVDYFPYCIDFQIPGLSRKTVLTEEKEWKALVYQMALHEIGAEHVTVFEVWNEPSFYMALKESKGVPGYLDLYKYTAIELEKAANTLGVHIEVGGPGVDELGQIDNSWISALANYVVKDHLPLDFVSWHQYANDPDTGPQAFAPQGICETGAPQGGQPCWDNPNFDVSLYQRGAESVRAALAQYPSLANAVLWVDEWAPDSGNDVRASQPFGAAFVAAALDGAQQSGIGRMSYYDVADDPNDPTYSNFGILSGNLTPKPDFYTFSFWHQLAGSLLPVTLTPDQGPGPGAAQVGAVASVGPDGTVRVMVYNFDAYDPTGNYGTSDPTPYDDPVTLQLSGLSAASYSESRALVDGSDQDTTVGTSTVNGPSASLGFTLAGEGVTLITLTPNG